MSKLTILVLLFLLTISCTSELNKNRSSVENNGNKGDGFGIISGDEKERADAPYYVSLYRIVGDAKYFLCGGSLLEHGTVLTAAHCIFNRDQSMRPWYSLQVDVYNKATDSLEEINVIDGMVHPNYNDETLTNDLAILLLAEGKGETVESISLPTFEEIEPGATLNVYGRGQDDYFNYGYFYGARLSYISNESCQEKYDENPNPNFPLKVTSDMLCATETVDDGDGVRDGACYGDSGGPLVQNLGGHDVLVGVVSWGAHCGGRTPDVFSRVSANIDWIWETSRTLGEQQRAFTIKSNSEHCLNFLHRVSGVNIGDCQDIAKHKWNIIESDGLAVIKNQHTRKCIFTRGAGVDGYQTSCEHRDPRMAFNIIQKDNGKSVLKSENDQICLSSISTSPEKRWDNLAGEPCGDDWQSNTDFEWDIN